MRKKNRKRKKERKKKRRRKTTLRIFYLVPFVKNVSNAIFKLFFSLF